MKKKDEKAKTRMQKICNALGLEMHQLFIVTDENGLFSEPGGLYFFTEHGICRDNGEPAQGLLETLAAGEMDIEPLDDYRHADRVDAESLTGREIKAKIMTAEADGLKKELYAVSTIGEQGAAWETWEIKMYYDGCIYSVQSAGLTEAVEVYNEELLDFCDGEAVEFYNKRELARDE